MIESIFFALIISVAVAVFFRLPKPALLLLLGVLLTAFAHGNVGPTGIGIVLATFISAYGYYLGAKNTLWKSLSCVAFIVCSVLLATRALPLFHNWQIVPPFKLSDVSAPYAIWWNFEKPILAILITSFAILAKREIPSPANFLRAAGIGFLGIITVISLAVIWGYIDWEPKFPSVFWLWIVTNLFITCAGEEALFRGFYLKELERLFDNRNLKMIIPLVTSSLLFGLAHYAGGLKYMALATLAGMFYGRVYQKTDRLWVPIALHLLLNTTHFLLFTYPSIQAGGS